MPKNTLLGESVDFFKIIIAPSQPDSSQRGCILRIEPNVIDGLYRRLKNRIDAIYGR